jgi:hypothetical protein
VVFGKMEKKMNRYISIPSKRGYYGDVSSFKRSCPPPLKTPKSRHGGEECQTSMKA